MKILRTWLQNEFTQKANPQKDTILIISLSQTQVKDAIVIGKGTFDIDEVTGTKNSLFF